MNPKENKKKSMSEMNKLLPSDLLKEDEDSADSQSSNSIAHDFNNYILEEQEPEPKETFFPNFDSSDSDFRQLKTPTTRYSDSYLLNNYRPSIQMMINSSSPQPRIQPNIQQPYGPMHLMNQSYIPNSPQMSCQMNEFCDFSFQLQQNSPLQPQPQPRMMPIQFMSPQKMSSNYLEQMNYGYQSMQYQSNDSLINITNTNSNFNTRRLQSPVAKKKYNSSSNISSQFMIQNSNANPNNDRKKNSNKRNRSSLFVNKSSENKDECDIRDFKRFCDGLKCEIDLYICSQIGSRIMQKYLTKFPFDILTLLINKLSFNIPKIMVDKYGNYFCQKLIKISSKEQRILILQYIQVYFHIISKESTGTHVLQTLLEVIDSIEEETIILNAITGHELEMTYDTNGTHVLQQILIAIEEQKRESLNNILLDNFKELCLNPKGICVIKKLISTSSSNSIRLIVIKLLSSDFLEIAESPYGNYLIQYIIEEWKIEKCPEVFALIRKDIIYLSMQKFSSNIIEKLISHSTIELQIVLIKELFTLNNFYTLITSKYGKFILTKCISVMDKDLKCSIHKELIEVASKSKKNIKSINEIFNIDNNNNAHDI